MKTIIIIIGLIALGIAINALTGGALLTAISGLVTRSITDINAVNP